MRIFILVLKISDTSQIWVLRKHLVTEREIDLLRKVPVRPDENILSLIGTFFLLDLFKVELEDFELICCLFGQGLLNIFNLLIKALYDRNELLNLSKDVFVEWLIFLIVVRTLLWNNLIGKNETIAVLLKFFQLVEKYLSSLKVLLGLNHRWLIALRMLSLSKLLLMVGLCQLLAEWSKDFQILVDHLLEECIRLQRVLLNRLDSSIDVLFSFSELILESWDTSLDFVAVFDLLVLNRKITFDLIHKMTNLLTLLMRLLELFNCLCT